MLYRAKITDRFGFVHKSTAICYIIAHKLCDKPYRCLDFGETKHYLIEIEEEGDEYEVHEEFLMDDIKLVKIKIEENFYWTGYFEKLENFPQHSFVNYEIIGTLMASIFFSSENLLQFIKLYYPARLADLNKINKNQFFPYLLHDIVRILHRESCINKEFFQILEKYIPQSNSLEQTQKYLKYISDSWCNRIIERARSRTD